MVLLAFCRKQSLQASAYSKPTFTQGLEGGVLIPYSRSVFTRIPHPALFHRCPESCFFFPKNTFKKD